jgi:predicted transposase YbfD/YdcC
VVLKRKWIQKNQPNGEEKSHTRHFLTSLGHEQARRIGDAIRGHWSIENRNHYKRDTSLWQEDSHGHRRINIAQNLALTRNALLAIMPFAQGQSLASCFEVYQRHPSKAIQLILCARPVP